MAMHGMAWHGMVWYGMVWYGRYGTSTGTGTGTGTVWYGMVWYGMVTATARGGWQRTCEDGEGLCGGLEGTKLGIADWGTGI